VEFGDRALRDPAGANTPAVTTMLSRALRRRSTVFSRHFANRWPDRDVDLQTARAGPRGGYAVPATPISGRHKRIGEFRPRSPTRLPPALRSAQTDMRASWLGDAHGPCRFPRPAPTTRTNSAPAPLQGQLRFSLAFLEQAVFDVEWLPAVGSAMYSSIGLGSGITSDGAQL